MKVGRERWTLYPVRDGTTRKTLARSASHILRENEWWRREWPDMLPPGYLIIAENAGGDHLILAPDDDQVRLWEHETGHMTPVVVHWE